MTLRIAYFIGGILSAFSMTAGWWIGLGVTLAGLMVLAYIEETLLSGRDEETE